MGVLGVDALGGSPGALGHLFNQRGLTGGPLPGAGRDRDDGPERILLTLPQGRSDECAHAKSPEILPVHLGEAFVPRDIVNHQGRVER